MGLLDMALGSENLLTTRASKDITVAVNGCGPFSRRYNEMSRELPEGSGLWVALWNLLKEG